MEKGSRTFYQQHRMNGQLCSHPHLNFSASNADLVLWTDAATSNRGMGIFIPNNAFTHCKWHPSHYWRGDKLTTVDVNILEFLAILIGVIFALGHTHHLPTNPHIHVWSDNTSGISWITKSDDLKATFTFC